MDWFLLPPATETMAQDVALCAKGRFIGDPSHVYEHVLTLTEGQLDEVVVSRRMIQYRVPENKSMVGLNIKARAHPLLSRKNSLPQSTLKQGEELHKQKQKILIILHCVYYQYEPFP